MGQGGGVSSDSKSPLRLPRTRVGSRSYGSGKGEKHPACILEETKMCAILLFPNAHGIWAWSTKCPCLKTELEGRRCLFPSPNALLVGLVVFSPGVGVGCKPHIKEMEITYLSTEAGQTHRTYLVSLKNKLLLCVPR